MRSRVCALFGVAGLTVVLVLINKDTLNMDVGCSCAYMYAQHTKFIRVGERFPLFALRRKTPDILAAINQ
jgi:hypothetical protein